MFLWCCQVYAEYCETNTKREGRHAVELMLAVLLPCLVSALAVGGFLYVGVVLVRITFCRLRVPRGAVFLPSTRLEQMFYCWKVVFGAVS